MFGEIRAVLHQTTKLYIIQQHQTTKLYIIYYSTTIIKEKQVTAFCLEKLGLGCHASYYQISYATFIYHSTPKFREKQKN